MRDQTPTFGIPVRNLARSVRFYRNAIGLSVEGLQHVPDAAMLTTPQQQRFVLAGPDAPAWSELLSDDHAILNPGDKVFMYDPEFDDRLQCLTQEGTIEFELIVRPWGDRGIEATCPDGFGVSLWKPVQRSTEDIARLITVARESFAGSLTDLSEADLTRRPGPEEWSIQEIIHHVADSNLTVLHAVRVALAEPGKLYRSNPYDQRLYASELRYRDRPVEPSLKLIESTCDTLTAMVSTIPDAWTRSIVTSTGNETTVDAYLLMLAIHDLEHVEQINDCREHLGYPRHAYLPD